MRAGELEFRYRFWTIFLLFWLAFGAYFVDHRNAAESLVRRLAGLAPDSPPGLLLLHAILGLAALLVGAAALLRTWAGAYLKSSVVHDTELHTEGIVADGPFRHVRNPLYLGNILLAVGMGLLASRLGFFVLVVGMTVIALRLIGREEQELLASQGQRYRAYAAAVPRLWPSLAPRLPASGERPRWLQAFAGEAFAWILFAGTVYLAVTLNGRAIPYGALAGMVFYLAMLAVLKRRRGAGAGAPR